MSLTRRRHRSDHLCPLHPRVVLPIPLLTEVGLALGLEVLIPAVVSRVRPVEVGRTPRVLVTATRTEAGHFRLRETTDFLRGLLYRLAHHGMGHRLAGRKGETTNDVIDPIRAAQAGDLQTMSTRTFLTTTTLTSVCAMPVIKTPNQTQNGAIQIAVTIAMTLLDDAAEVPASEIRAEGDFFGSAWSWVWFSDSHCYQNFLKFQTNPRFGKFQAEVIRQSLLILMSWIFWALSNYRSWKYISLRKVAALDPQIVH